jgi:hypothetical protein
LLVGYVKALFPYNSTRDDELSFACGDFIAVVRKTDSGWWRGACNGKFGMFPLNRTKELELESLGTATVKYNFNARRRDELTIAKGEQVDIMRLRNKDWFLVRHEHVIGNFPACYLQYDMALHSHIQPAKILKPVPTASATSSAGAGPNASAGASAGASASASAGASASASASASPGGFKPPGISRLPSQNRFGGSQGSPSPMATPPTGAMRVPSPNATPPTASPLPAASAPPAAAPPPVMPRAPPVEPREPKKQCQVLYSYEARYPNELTITKGDIIDIISQTGNWWEGELNGNRGQFPNNYVQLL